MGRELLGDLIREQRIEAALDIDRRQFRKLCHLVFGVFIALSCDTPSFRLIHHSRGLFLNFPGDLRQCCIPG